jgi:hypothetical protein
LHAQVDLPYHYLVEAINKKACRGLLVRADGSARHESEVHGIASRAWQLTNDSIRSAARLLYSPQTIAVACLSMALEEDGKQFQEQQPDAVATAIETTLLASIAAEFNVDAAQCADVRAMTLMTVQRTLARPERGAAAGAGAAIGAAGGAGAARTAVSAYPPSAQAQQVNSSTLVASSAASNSSSGSGTGASSAAASSSAKRSIDQVRDTAAATSTVHSRVGDQINSAEGGGKVARHADTAAAPALPASSSVSSSARESTSSVSSAPASSSKPSSAAEPADADPFEIDDDELVASASSTASLAPGTGDHMISSASNGSGSGSAGGSLTHSGAVNDSWESNSLPPNVSHGMSGMQSCERGDNDGDDAHSALNLGAVTPFLGGADA